MVSQVFSRDSLLVMRKRKLLMVNEEDTLQKRRLQALKAPSMPEKLQETSPLKDMVSKKQLRNSETN